MWEQIEESRRGPPTSLGASGLPPFYTTPPGRVTLLEKPHFRGMWIARSAAASPGDPQAVEEGEGPAIETAGQ